MFIRSRNVSVTYAMLFAAIGLIALFAVVKADAVPMALPLTGGFMLVGPFLLLGYFRIADCLIAGQVVNWREPFAGFRKVPRAMFAVAAVCALFFLIWITDAATLYGFMIGEVPVSLQAMIPPGTNVRLFILWSSLMGAVLAFVIFSVLGFAVPLLYYRRAGLTGAVILSVRAVFNNFFVCIVWAVLLAVTVMGSILVLPLFLVAFPVMAYASHSFYHQTFSPAD